MNETLQFCTHGAPIKFGCYICLSKKEKDVSYDEVVTTILDHHLNKLNKLEEHRLRQIDENRLISKRVDDLENDIINSDDNVNDELNYQSDDITRLELKVALHEEYLKKIDKIALCDPDKVAANQKHLENNISKLESQLSALTEMYKEISLRHVKLIDIEMSKKPHKCPVCSGACIFKIHSMEDVIANNGISFKTCPACKGNGIIYV
jgi:DNA repair exonuclease SbcCD ATPase subunit